MTKGQAMMPDRVRALARLTRLDFLTLFKTKEKYFSLTYLPLQDEKDLLYERERQELRRGSSYQIRYVIRYHSNGYNLLWSGRKASHLGSSIKAPNRIQIK